MKRVNADAPCPCGSDEKYKNCCWEKEFSWVEDDDGNISKSTPMSPELEELLQEQKERFRERYGREATPDDYIFFAQEPDEHLEFHLAQGMRSIGIPPELIYAFEKTGLIVTEMNLNLISKKDPAEWDAAIEEYFRKRDRGELDDLSDLLQ